MNLEPLHGRRAERYFSARWKAVSVLVGFLLFSPCLAPNPFCSLFSMRAAAQQAPEAPLVKAIEVRGNRRVERQTILFHVKTKVGDRFSVPAIRKDLRTIFGLNFFKDVRIETEDFEGGLKVLFVVEEQPSVREITLKGNKRVDEDKIKERIKVARRTVLNQQLIKESATDISALYEEEGYVFATVNPIVKRVSDLDVDIVFEIDEGVKLKIAAVTFTGNDHISARRLRKRLLLKKKSLLSFLTGGGKFRREALPIDRLRVKAAYDDEGFIRAEVSDAQVDFDRQKRQIRIHYDIVEGPRYNVGTIEIQGDEVYSTEQLLAKVGLKAGKTFNRSRLRKDIVLLTNLYADVGYAYADVIPLVKQDDEERLVNITFQVDRGQLVTIGRIIIRGNHRTRDHVVRREFQFAEGDQYQGTNLQRSQRRIRNLGFFEDVQVRTKRREKDDLLDIETTVQEQSTGSITGGIGFSTAENILLSGSISERNFLGKGQSMSLRVSFSSIRTNYTFSFGEPYLFGSKVSFNFDLFNREDQFDTFTQDTSGGNLRLGRRLSRHIRIGLGYRFEDTSIDDIDTINAPALVRRQNDADFTISAVAPTIVWDSRDNRSGPTKGMFHRVFSEASGLLGGTSFYKFSGESRWYYPFRLTEGQRKPLVVALRGRASKVHAFGSDQLPVFERYFLGGTDNLRGFKFREAGPLDLNGDPLGGTSEILLTSELRFPIPKISVIGGLVFVDAGNVFCEDDPICGGQDFDLSNMRYTAGGGVVFDSPLGTVRLEVGWKLDKRENEDPSEIHFRFGRNL